MTFKIRIATRRSRLALRQVEIVKSYLGQEVQTETVEVITSADKILNKSLSDLGGKGSFYQGIRKLYLK
jgi:hydroxymethylbilane synthase